jgi:hypothetical protein
MSNNDTPDIKKDRGRGLRDSNKTSDGHGVRGKTGSPHVTSETQREHRHIEQDQSQGHTDGLPFKNSFDFILTPTPHMFGIGRKLLISQAQKNQHA